MNNTNNTASNIDRISLTTDDVRAAVLRDPSVRARIECCSIACRIRGHMTTTGGYAVVIRGDHTAGAIAARFYHRAGAEAFIAQCA